MAYTPPLGNAINFDGTGAPYTPPLGNAINFDTVGGNIVITLAGQQASTQQGAFTTSISGGDSYAALAGQELTTQQSSLVASIPGGSYSILLVGLGLTVQQSTLVAGIAYVVPLVGQGAAAQRGGVVASTPTTVSVPLIGQALAAQYAAISAFVFTGTIEWTAWDANITVTGTPRLIATANSSPFPTVYSNGDAAAYGSKRYVEIAVTGKNTAYGLGNNWRRTFSSQPLGMSTFQGEDQYAWSLWLKSDNTLQISHNAVGMVVDTYTYTVGAPVMIAVDFDTGKMWLGYNGIWMLGGDPVAGTNPTYIDVVGPFPHPVTILGSMGVSSKGILNATENNQLYRPAGFLPWQDSSGSTFVVGLTGLQLKTTQNTSFQFGPGAVPAGQVASVQIGALGVDLGIPHVTWNPNDKHQLVVLTDQNMGLTVDVKRRLSVNDPIVGTFVARATVGHGLDSGKYYFEAAIPYIAPYFSGSKAAGIGVSMQFTSTFNANNTAWSGFFTVDLIGMWEGWLNLGADGPSPPPPNPVNGFQNNFGNYIPPPFYPNQVLQCAIDFNLGWLWFGYNNRWFDGSNPSLGTDPQYTNLRQMLVSSRNTVFPMAWPDFISDLSIPPPPSVIGHFRADSFNFAPPTGFKPWEEMGVGDVVANLKGLGLTVRAGRFALLTDAGVSVTLLGSELTVSSAELRPTRIVGRQVVVQHGRFGIITDAGTFMDLDGLQASAQVGTLAPKVIPVIVVTLTGQQLTVKSRSFPVVQNGADVDVYLFGQEAATTVGTLSPVFTFGLTSVFATGAVTAPLFAATIAPLVPGLQATVQLGALTGSISQGAAVPLVGLQSDIAQGAFTTIAGYNIGLAGSPMNMEGGTLTPGISVSQTGLTMLGVVGLLNYDLAFALTGLQCEVQGGRLVPEGGLTLVGQSVSSTFGKFTPELALRLVSVQVQVSQGAPVALLSPSLSGLSLVTHGGVLQFTVAVPLTGQQATVMQGSNGYMYDCNISITGVEAIGVLGAEPLLTNVPKPKRDVYMWAKFEVEKLFIQAAPEDLFNDIEPTD